MQIFGKSQKFFGNYQNVQNLTEAYVKCTRLRFKEKWNIYLASSDYPFFNESVFRTSLVYICSRNEIKECKDCFWLMMMIRAGLIFDRKQNVFINRIFSSYIDCILNYLNDVTQAQTLNKFQTWNYRPIIKILIWSDPRLKITECIFV